MVSALTLIKGSIFGLVLVIIAIQWCFRGRPVLDWRVSFWTMGLTLVGFFFVLEGLAKGTPGAVAVTTVYVFWPLAFGVWAASLSSGRIFAEIEWTAVIATIFIGIYGCAYVLTQLNILPYADLFSTLSFGWSEQGFGAYEGYTQIAIAGMNSLPFLLPLVMASIAIEDSVEKRSLLGRICLWAALAFGSALVFASGRRALMLAAILTPLLTWFFRSFQPSGDKKRNRRSLFKLLLILSFLAILFCIGFASVYQFDSASLWQRFSSGFDLGSQTQDESAIARHEQLIVLFRAWLENPLLGAGHGASALGSIRSEDMPWAYELTYMSLLFQTGIIGFAAYAGGVLWIFYQGIKIIKEGGRLSRIMLPMLVGLANLIIANATNPYLLKFDGMWMLFLPIAVVNYRLVSERAERKASYRRSDPLSFEYQ
jgi:O-antigen ligase